MTKEEELQNSLSETIDYYEKYISELNHQSVMVYAAARNYEDKCTLLQDQLALTEKALELACFYYHHDSCSNCDCDENCSSCTNRTAETLLESIKKEAKEMMKSE